MKQTAVEWLYNKFSTCTSDELVGNINNWFEQAKEMEKEQQSYSEKDLREAFRQGENNVGYNSKYHYTFKLTEKEWFEQFKKETFKSE